jgi:hypothetical protein
VQSFVTKFKDEFVAKGAQAEEAAKRKIVGGGPAPTDVRIAASLD